jgi:hypothetical protein
MKEVTLTLTEKEVEALLFATSKIKPRLFMGIFSGVFYNELSDKILNQTTKQINGSYTKW